MDLQVAPARLFKASRILRRKVAMDASGLNPPNGVLFGNPPGPTSDLSFSLGGRVEDWRGVPKVWPSITVLERNNFV
jgi:hypothetical protein